ncbi:MAG TPA: amidohydrolase [Terriglobales bacterium]|nr:amidohydrolase [Terriglobales bacterium]
MHAQAPQPDQSPDAIFVNGNVYTGAEEGFGGAPAKVYPRAQAFAVRNGRIIDVGSNDSIRRLKGPRTEVVDLAGHFVMPGLNDAHTHLGEAGLEKLSVDLVGVKSLAEMKQRIAEFAKTAAPGEWLTGGGWDHTKWQEQKLPTKEDLDAVSGDHPAVFSRVDGHISVANSAALKEAGITAETKDPFGGKIDRDAKGEPTGILRESAKGLVNRHIPPPSPSKRRRAAEVALADAAHWGLTSLQDNSDWEFFLVYEDMENEGKLTARISEWLPFGAPVDELNTHRAHHDHSDPMLHTGMLKGFMDGSLGSRTAAMLAPYSDDPGNSGLPQYTQEQLDQMATERALAGFQMGFHAIGDRATQMALQAFEAAEGAGFMQFSSRHAPGSQEAVRAEYLRTTRFRIEHSQVTAPDQFARYRQLGVIASMQPNHLLTDMNWAESRIGAQRAAHSYAWNEFLKNHVWLAFGTDYPVEPITPFRGLYAAVTRKNEAGTKEYFPEQKISIDQAIAAYTTGSAYAEFAEQDKGRLAPGFWADFIVLDRDITKVAPPEILKTTVLRTVVGGKTVYQK